eukprot:tig00000808_g4429.t1
MAHAAPGGIKHTQSPTVTGTSVIAIKYKDGVMLTADTLGSYGSLARYKGLQRMQPVGKYTVVGAGGEYSDFQEIIKMLNELIDEDFCSDDGVEKGAAEIHSYLGRVMYNRRSKINPLWNSLVVAGYRNGQSFLGVTDMLGTTYVDNFVATGYGNYLAMPLLRSNWRPDLTEAEAKKLLEDCMRVLFYRDARTINRIQCAKIDAAGPVVSQPYSLETNWEFRDFTRGARSSDLSSW